MDKILDIRPSPIAGTWYSGDPTQLKSTVDKYIENADIPDLPGDVLAVVAPHAGYRYSGGVAGHAFKAVKGQAYDFVLVISPLHQYHPQPILTSAHAAYQTPLGKIPIEKHILDQIQIKLKEKIGADLTPIRNDKEHALEIQLPFLQRAIDGAFNLVPIMLRDQSRSFAKALGELIAEIIRDKSCLIVASSDLSHFHPETIANKLDQKVLQAVAEFSPETLFDLKDQGLGQACGLAPIAATLWASRALGGDKVTLLSYDTSAATTGDRSSVVGYGAAAITRSI
ncbi:MAG: AmmeMemoRadiSam system protein B [Chloroflexota bacterium]|nr:AmmeMemoRadiSam system protein B [Chloroflexota bacterium]